MNYKKLKIVFTSIAGLIFAGLNAHASINYSYDNIGRLTHVSYDNGGHISYDYDAAGNITQITSNFTSMDTDGDGMSDSWEINNNLNPHVNDASLDADSDTYTNLEEYQAGTNPQDPNSHPVVSGFTVTTNASSGGSVSPSTRTVSSGNTTTFTITANTDYNINFVSGCGGSLSGTTFTTAAITADCSVKADFSYKYTSTGWGHSCFKDNTGQVKCWGR